MTSEYTAEMTPAEREETIALWDSRPAFKALERNPVIAAVRRATARTNWRVGWTSEGGRIKIHLTAFRIGKNDRATGRGQIRELTACDSVAEAVAYLDALKAPE